MDHTIVITLRCSHHAYMVVAIKQAQGGRAKAWCLIIHTEASLSRGPGRKPRASFYTRKRLSLSRGIGRKPGASSHTRKRLGGRAKAWCLLLYTCKRYSISVALRAHLSGRERHTSFHDRRQVILPVNCCAALLQCPAPFPRRRHARQLVPVEAQELQCGEGSERCRHKGQMVRVEV